MKHLLLSFAAIFILTISVKAQEKKFYTTSGGEMIFSFATIDDNGNTKGNIIRWTPFFNVQFYGNYDVNKNIGFIFGAAIRNVGFIYEPSASSNSAFAGTKKKFRNYDLGIPIGIKIGNMKKAFIFAGYEIEFPFNYKEKVFENEVKTDNFSIWFSDRVPTYYNTFFAGVQFPYGLSLKFKYYLTGFLNEDYTETVDGNPHMPYKGLKANIFYFSISTSLFKGHDVYIKEYKEGNIY